MSKKDNTPQEIVIEYCVATGDKPGVGIFTVLRSFYLPVRKGPNVKLSVGALCELSAETATEAFCLKRVYPYDPPIPTEAIYRVLKPFRIVINGLWVDLQINEKIQLTQDEAVEFLREQKLFMEEVIK